MSSSLSALFIVPHYDGTDDVATNNKTERYKQN